MNICNWLQKPMDHLTTHSLESISKFLSQTLQKDCWKVYPSVSSNVAIETPIYKWISHENLHFAREFPTSHALWHRVPKAAVPSLWQTRLTTSRKDLGAEVRPVTGLIPCNLPIQIQWRHDLRSWSNASRIMDVHPPKVLGPGVLTHTHSGRWTYCGS